MMSLQSKIENKIHSEGQQIINIMRIVINEVKAMKLGYQLL